MRNLTCTLWQDVKIVRFASTMAKPHVTTYTMRRIAHTYVRVNQPHVASVYSQHYKGVDFSDQLLSAYHFGRKSTRSWKYLFDYFCNIAIVNSYVLFKEASTLSRQKSYSHLDFRHEVAIGLIAGYSSCKLPPALKPMFVGPDATERYVNHQNVRMNVERVQRCRGHRKFHGSVKRTVWGCSACQISLCKECHPLWHNA